MMPPRAPHKAVLLAAGFGSRMVPLSHDLPKPMMPLWGIPVIEHVINALRRAGVTEFLINQHHQPQPLLDWCRRQRDPSIHLQLSFEPQILGTGGALRRAAHFVGSEPFWLVNTDIAFELDLQSLIKDFCRHRPLATLWMHETRGPRTVEMTPDGNITNFASAASGGPGTFTFCGVQLLQPAILSFLPEEPFCSVVDGYRRALAQGVAVRGCLVENTYWADLGSPERYLDAHRDIAQAHRRKLPGAGLLLDAEARRMRRAIPAGTRIDGFAAIGRDVRIASSVTLADSVLWDGARLHPGIRVASSVAGRAADVRGDLDGSTLVRADALPSSDPVLAAAFRALRASPGEAMLTALPARGSDRSFERLAVGRRSSILIRYDDRRRAENGRYAGIARALAAAGIRVPKVLLDLPVQKAVLFEDAGTRSLQDALPGMSRRVRLHHYRRAIGQVAILHGLVPEVLPPLEPPFSPALYQWEHDLFATCFLRDTLHLPPARIEEALAELAPVAQHLLAQPLVPVHRDLQSSNILLRHGGPVLIDFQGLRLGAAAYDLASLLCDPYAMLDARDRTLLLDAYCTLVPDGEAVRHAFAAAAIQRLAQALGAYGRLSAIPATRRFARYIPPACAMLAEILGKGPLFDILREIHHETH